MNQAELAQRIGVHQQTVSKWENGRARPSPARIAALEKALGLDASELRRADEEMSAISEARNNPALPVSPLASALPFGELAPDRFEQFCTDFVQLLRPSMGVTLFGSQGHKQDGIDLLATSNERIETFQCKRVKQFGPARVAGVVACVEIEADHHHLVLSRASASPEARKEILKHANWTLWDGADISRLIRFNLAEGDAVRLVDTYFPGWRSSFLGVPDPGPWLTSDELFAPHMREGIYSHGWQLVGRDQELRGLLEFASSTTAPRVGLIVGRGGLGKTRLLRSVAEDARSTAQVEVRFLSDPDAAPGPRDYQLLPPDRLMVVIDDAQKVEGLPGILNAITRARPEARILLATRPRGENSLYPALREVCIHPEELPKWSLSDLDIDDATQLASEVLGPGYTDMVAKRLGALTRDCPLITVVGAALVRRGNLDVSRLHGNNEMRQEILRAFRSALVADSDEGLRATVLDAVALLQPIRLDDENFHSALAALTNAPFDQIARQLDRLEHAGVMLQRGRSVRIVPDLLGDAILYEACLSGRSAAPTGYVRRALAVAEGAAAQHILVNASRLDWQAREGGVVHGGNLSEEAWSLVSAEFRSAGIRGRVKVLEVLRKVAFFQPDKTLDLIEWALANPTDEVEAGGGWSPPGYRPTYDDVRREIARVLRNLAYNIEYLGRALDLLWEVARKAAHSATNHPEHALGILRDLAAYEPRKPLRYNELVLDKVEAWCPAEAKDLTYSALEVIEPMLATEGSEDSTRGYTLVFQPFAVNLKGVAQLRRRAINLILREAASTDLRRAVRAVKLLGKAIRYPSGLYGRTVTSEERDRWTPEFVHAIREMAGLVSNDGLDPVVSIAVRTELFWHAAHSTTATKEEAARACTAAPTNLQHDFAVALHGGRDLLDLNHVDYRVAELAKRERMESVAARLCEDFSFAELAVNLEDRLQRQQAAFGDQGWPGPFVRTLVERSPDLAEEVCRRVASRPESALMEVVPIALAALADARPETTMELAQRLRLVGEHGARQVAAAVGPNRGARKLIAGELELLEELASDRDPIARVFVARGIRRLADVDEMAARHLALRVSFSDSTEVANAFFELFGEKAPLQWEGFERQELDSILAQLQKLPNLDNYQVAEALKAVVSVSPWDVLKLLMARIEHAEVAEGDRANRSRPLPFEWPVDLGFREHDDFTLFLRTIRDWIGEKLDSWMRQDLGAELFEAVVGAFDSEAIEVLDEALAFGDLEKVRTVGAILKAAPKSLVWSNIDLVARVLRSAERQGKDCMREVRGSLRSAAASGTRMGLPGQPFPQDIEQRDRAAALARQLPSGSVEQQFYRALERDAEASIAMDREDAFDNREW